jgi:hypothetical protein
MSVATNADHDEDCRQPTPEEAMRVWPVLSGLVLPGETVPLAELIERLEGAGIKEGWLDGVIGLFETFPWIQTNEDLDFTNTKEVLE